MLMLLNSWYRPPNILTKQVVRLRIFVHCAPETPGGAEHHLCVDVPWVVVTNCRHWTSRDENRLQWRRAGDVISSNKENCRSICQPSFWLEDIVDILALISLHPSLLEVLLSVCNLQRCSATSSPSSSCSLLALLLRRNAGIWKPPVGIQ